jgi:hypothetical protein
MNGVKAGTALAMVAAVAAVAPAAAAADQRHAAPGATGPEPCVQADPCGFQTAVQGAADGDEVIVAPGVHDVAGPVTLNSGATVHGVEGQEPPRIVSAAGTALEIDDPDAKVRWLEIRHSGGADGLLAEDGEARLLTVQSSGPGFACHVQGATLRDSVCWSTGAGASAVGAEVAAEIEDRSELLNVTAVASGAGSRGLRVAGSAAGFADVMALNTIVKGAGVDTEVETDATSIAVALLDYSNFATQSLIGPRSHATAPGLSYNEVIPPAFRGAATGDFRQDPASVTVDRGTLDTFFGDTDIEGEARVQGFNIDVGADEIAIGPLPPDTDPPETRILKKPGRRSKGRRAKFKFGTTEPYRAVFMCSRDGKAFRQCKSPERFRVKRGKHSFAVYSIDESGNADPTPDQYSWKVRRKPKDD